MMRHHAFLLLSPLMSGRRWVATGLTVAMVVAGSGAILPGWSAPSSGAKRLSWSQLNLTQEQHRQFLEAEGDWRRTYESVQPELMRVKGQLRYLMHQADGNEAEVKRLQQRSQDLQEMLQHKATECFMRKKKVLTPEQRQRMMQLMNAADPVDP